MYKYNIYYIIYLLSLIICIIIFTYYHFRERKYIHIRFQNIYKLILQWIYYDNRAGLFSNKQSLYDNYPRKKLGIWEAGTRSFFPTSAMTSHFKSIMDADIGLWGLIMRMPVYGGISYSKYILLSCFHINFLEVGVSLWARKGSRMSFFTSLTKNLVNI